MSISGLLLFRFTKSCICRYVALALACGLLAVAPAAAAHLPVPTDCTNDLQGPNDEPGQKDLTQFCVESVAAPHELNTSWNWDNVMIAGGSTNDACTLYTTDPDGFANLAVCVTNRDGGNPANLGSVRLFTCNNTRPDRCAGGTQLLINKCSGGSDDGQACTLESDCEKPGVCVPDPSIANTTCEVSQEDTDPFPAGTDYPTDTVAVCLVDLNDFGADTSAVLIDACSYPSESVNSDPSDCITFQACTLDSQCNDDNACTTDTCELIPNTNSSSCQFTPDTGEACGDSSDTACTNPDTCNELGFCEDNDEPTTTECRPSTGTCDVPESCDGEGACPADGSATDGTLCGDASDTDCDNPDTCLAGICVPNVAPDGTTCGSGSDTDCDNPDSCVAGACVPNYEPIITECRPDAGECDVPENCDGAGSCPADGFVTPGTPCGNPGDGECDLQDTCDADGVCDDNVADPGDPCDDGDACTSEEGIPGTPDGCNGTGECVSVPVQCSDDLNECTNDTCVGGVCNTPVADDTVCGSGSDTDCDNPDSCLAGACVPNYEPIITECRPDAGECDVPENCDGAGSCPADGFEGDGAVCGSGSDTDCDNPDSCLAGACVPNYEPIITECRPDAGECDVPENCDGAGSCPADGFEGDGAVCGSGSDTDCDNPDSCLAGACVPNYEPIITECRPDAGECDVPENCDGAGSCPADGFEGDGAVCGSGSDTDCDNPDSCLAGACVPNYEPIITECRPDAGECDVPENCDGAGSCPADGFEGDGAVCGSGSDTDCDNPDSCLAGACVPNYEPIITECRPDAGECDVPENCDGAGSCPADGFEGDGAVCGSGSDTDCDNPDSCLAGACVPNYEPIITECRPDAGECDVPENCDGAGSCPADGFEGDGAVCGSGSDTDCDNPDSCLAGACVPNYEPIITECRPDAGECDVPENCDGAGSCPADGFEGDGAVCGSGSDTDCDNPDSCLAGACVPNYEPIITECRPDAGECDVPENCDGAGSCPADGFEGDGAVCGSGSDTDCDNPDSCLAGACVPNYEPIITECRPDAGECDVPENCDGAGSCPADGFEGDGAVCGSGSDTDCDNPDSCLAGACVPNYEPIITECRPDAGECDVPENCDGAGSCPADGFEGDGAVCGSGSDTDCDNPDSCLAGACVPNYEPIITECRPDAGECDVPENCDGAGSCPADGFEDEGTDCGDDTDNTCTDPDTCDADGECQSNNTACGSVTDSSLCLFDVSPKGICIDDVTEERGDHCDVETGDPDCATGSTCTPENQFRLLFTPDHQNWVAYKLNASNPGQFYYNLNSSGTPGESETFSISIPYPFVTHGATPIHVYDGETVGNADGEDCFMPPDGALDASHTQITTADWVSGVATDPTRNFLNCDSVCGPDGAGYCTFDVTATYPDSGQLYINVHLDYALKGGNVDLNPCDDGLVDRYDPDTIASPWNTRDAYVNTADDLLDQLAIDDNQDYTMGHEEVGTTTSFSDTVQNLNEFKKIAGVFGLCGNKGHSNKCVALTALQLVRNSTGEVVATTEIDVDGYFTIPYKHTGAKEMYTVVLQGDYNMTQEVELKANGFAEVTFTLPDGDGPGGVYKPREGPVDSSDGSN